jgi:hypothetical protein
MRVHVHAAVSQEANQTLTALGSKFHRELGWRQHRGDHWHACGQRLLHDLKRSASRHDQDVSHEREQAVEQAVSDNLVDGVVPADASERGDRPVDVVRLVSTSEILGKT